MALPVAVFVGEAQEWIPDLVERARKLKVGPGHLDVDIGPVVTRDSLKRIHHLIDEGVANGAKLLLDGRNPSVPAGFESGNWIGATILDNVQPNMSCYTEEVSYIQAQSKALDLWTSSFCCPCWYLGRSYSTYEC